MCKTSVYCGFYLIHKLYIYFSITVGFHQCGTGTINKLENMSAQKKDEGDVISNHGDAHAIS